MAPRARAVTRESLGAWLLKGSPEVHPVGEHVRSTFSTITSRCVRPTYRTDLIEAGQPVLFWISGHDPCTPAGIYAQGQTTGRAQDAGTVDRWIEEADPGERTLVMPVELEPVEPPVLRSEIAEHPLLEQIEVMKMAAGSNPSFLSCEQLRALRSRWPQVRTG